MSYKYFMPTRVIEGNDCIINNAEIFKTLGEKALIVTGAHSAKKNGSLSDVKAALEAVNISYLVFDNVMSNPTISCAYEGAEIARKNDIDFIIAIGGGSPMDAGKAIALLTAQNIPKENLFSGNYEQKVLPMAFVPTTAGTGSEVTQYSILTNDEAQTKTSIASDLLFPKVAFLDAKYMIDLSLTTTINTAMDALSHAVEGMLSVKASSITNALASASIETIISYVPEMIKALKSKDKVTFDLKMREELLHSSLMAGMVIAQTGTTAVHSMGYSLTYFKDIDHGRANGLLLGEYLNLVNKEQPDLATKILMAMNLPDVNSFKELMNEIFGEKEDISEEEIIKYSKMAILTKNIGNCVVKPTEEDLIRIYEVSFGK